MSESRRGGRPSGKGEFIDQVREMYLVEKMSLGEIAERIGKTTATVSAWIKSEGIPLEPRPRNANAGRTAAQQAEINERIRKSIATSAARQENPGGRPRQVERETRICPVDRQEFEARVNDGKEFCSLSCARVGQGREYTARKEREWLQSPESDCKCGEKIPYSLRRRRFCSGECAQTYGGIRQKDPANYRTRNCQNESCGKEFTRYKKYGNGDTRFCSNACARTHTKTRRFYAVEEFDIVFESSWECAFWGLAMIAKVPIERFDRQYGVSWLGVSQEGTVETWYAPDFWLPSVQAWKGRKGIAVEVKGVPDEQDEARWAAFRATGVDLVVMDRFRMERLTAHGLYDTLRVCTMKDNPTIHKEDNPSPAIPTGSDDAFYIEHPLPVPHGIADLSV